MTQFVHFLLFACLAVLVLLVGAEPAFAGMSEFFAGMGRRDRVIQVCVVTMCLALAILMKKFGPSSND